MSEGGDGGRLPEIRRHDLPERDLTDRARSLVNEADVTDRRTRFDARLDTVRRRQQRRRRRDLLVLGGVAVAVGVVAAVLGVVLVGPVGVLALPVGLLVPVGRRFALRAASRRGSQAWDWRRQRHVLAGDPSKEVQAQDDPRAGA